MQFRDGRAVWHKSPTYKLNKMRRYLGVEMEICGADESGASAVDATISRWTGCGVVGDGSLPDGGFEINTPPTNGDLFVSNITDLCSSLNNTGAWVDKRAGLHVHVDARDLQYIHLMSLIELYAKIEPGIYSVLPPSRRDNHYCQKCAAFYKQPTNGQAFSLARKRGWLGEKLYGSKEEATISARSKYKWGGPRLALNLHSWFMRGSIEFRHGAGTTNPQKIVNWATLCGGIVQFAKSRKYEIDALPTDSFEALCECAPNTNVRDWLVERRNSFASRG